MAFELRALIGPRSVLDGVSRSLPGSHVADLAEGLGLLPISFELESGFQPEERKGVFDGLRLSARVESLARPASASGALAYVEADYSAGRDFQASVLWAGGRLSGKPHADRTAWDPREPAMTERPINAVLRALGVQRHDYGDEWDAVGLARHPRTEEW